MSPKTPKNNTAAMLILAGCSCSGKDTLIKRLLEARPELKKVITSTTRAPRPEETPNESYYFLGNDEFTQKINNKEFLEWAPVHTERYGTTIQALDAVYASGRMPVGILDVQGVQTAKEKIPVTTVFISASMETLKSRMSLSRPPEQVAARMKSVESEIEAGKSFDKIIVNEDGQLEAAVNELLAHYDKSVKPMLERYRGQKQTPDRKPAATRKR